MTGGSGSGGSLAGPIDPNVPPSFPAPKYSFKVQMAWQEKPLTQRLEEKKKAEEAKKAAESEATESGDNLAVDTTGSSNR